MKKTLFCICLLTTLFASAEKKRPEQIISRANVSLNMATLLSGLPELQAEYYVNRYLGIAATGGYTLYPVRSGINVGDGVDIKSLNGGYVKAGLKGRYVFHNAIAPVVWLQAMYVYANYHEQGAKQDMLSSNVEQFHNSGSVNGYSFSSGVDIRMYKRLDLKLGAQVSYYNTAKRPGYTTLTFQPGFGANYFSVPMQLQLGVNYRIGSIKKATK